MNPLSPVRLTFNPINKTLAPSPRFGTTSPQPSALYQELEPLLAPPKTPAGEYLASLHDVSALNHDIEPRDDSSGYYQRRDLKFREVARKLVEKKIIDEHTLVLDINGVPHPIFAELAKIPKLNLTGVLYNPKGLCLYGGRHTVEYQHAQSTQSQLKTYAAEISQSQNRTGKPGALYVGLDFYFTPEPHFKPPADLKKLGIRKILVLSQISPYTNLQAYERFVLFPSATKNFAEEAFLRFLKIAEGHLPIQFYGNIHSDLMALDAAKTPV